MAERSGPWNQTGQLEQLAGVFVVLLTIMMENLRLIILLMIIICSVIVVHITQGFVEEFDMFAFKMCYGVNGWSSILCKNIILCPL